ncbi:MAG: TonB-dependent receptor [Verrucomicrobiota bacterium]
MLHRFRVLGVGPLCAGVCCFTSHSFAQAPAKEKAPDESIITLEKFIASEKLADPNSVLNRQPLGTAVGFARMLEDTPRSISVISSELVDKIGIRDPDQFYRIMPGTYTVNTFGIVGAAQIRNNTTDIYIRGMKRPQSNIRNVMTMWDSIEIVRGPPSPIYGNGRIGGYSNYVPKSVRGTTGRYLDQPQGSVSVIGGSYKRAEVQVNYAQPLGKEAGVQLFALVNDSDSYYTNNFTKDRVLQTSLSVNLNRRWRLETGGIVQTARNAGMSGANRITQATLDNGTYLRGTALVNLDFDGNGRVSEKEIQDSRAFPDGTVSGTNRPLTITFPFYDGGAPIVPGVPKAYQDLLRQPQYAAIAASPQGRAILAAPTGGPLAFAGTSGTLAQATQRVPVGFFLNPAELSYVARDWSMVPIEELQKGSVGTGYLDFVDDSDGDYTQKMQFFADYQHENKRSTLPFNRDQEITVLETKYTITTKASKVPFLNRLPNWAALDLLASINARYTDGGGVTTSGDYDHRLDVLGPRLPTDTFASYIEHGDRSFATGEPISSSTYSEFVEYGAGAMADMRLWDRLGIMLGARFDYTQATTVEDERYNRTAAPALSGTGNLLPRREAEGDDHAVSVSGSVSYKLPWLGLTPYFTASRASAILAGSRQDLAYGNVLAGNILGEATLMEAGFKGSAFNHKVYYAVAGYDQTRSSNVLEEGESFIRSTVNRGIEAEIRWTPNRHWSFILSGTWSKVERTQLVGFRTAQATASYIGFQDIKDAAGNVIVPAEAFLWGGIATVAIPASAEAYNEYGQYPDQVIGSFIGYTWDSGLGVTWNSSYVSKVSASSELKDLLILPSSYSHNISFFYDNRKSWRVSLNVRNVTDELYWNPNNGHAGGTLIHAAPPRNYELTVTRRF